MTNTPNAEAGRPILRKKNIALGLALLGLVVLFYLVTIVRLTDNVSPETQQNIGGEPAVEATEGGRLIIVEPDGGGG